MSIKKTNNGVAAMNDTDEIIGSVEREEFEKRFHEEMSEQLNVTFDRLKATKYYANKKRRKGGKGGK